MRLFTTILSALALVGALIVGSRPTGPVPPIGPFLDPANGIWAAARTADLPREQSLDLAGLDSPVEVRYDDRGVPHIFAKTEADAARALGWVHARDRLFQMELIQRAVDGTLTQLVGARALPLDQRARLLMLAEAANAKWEAIPDTAAVKREVTAYMEGVNAYVDGMEAKDLPVEYRLLNRRPRRFEPRDTYYLLMRMSQTLSYVETELRFAALEELVGLEAASALMPIEAPIQEPIEPVPGRSGPRFAWRSLPAPRPPVATQVAQARRIRDAAGQIAAATAMPWTATPERADDLTALLTRGEAVVGSNNWAVAPSRSASGAALLSGDPHLELTLPSIWYEAHLVVEGVMDVYGVTFPLAPIVPIGFNREMAWTMTNTGNDVVDYYRETVDDSASPRKYLVDGEWRDLEVRMPMYHLADGSTIHVDTLYATHRGPLIPTSLGWLSQRWTAREISDEGNAFRLGMRANGTRDFYARFENYRTPAQNMLTADRAGNIGIRSTGRYPIRPGDGRGDRVFDGSTSASDWTGNQPLSWYPQSYNPAQGYLASANQQPMDPAVRRGYLGSDWPSPWRAMRINALLRGNAQVTPDSMRAYQTNPYSELTPFLLTALSQAKAAAERAGTWSEEDARAAALLEQWDGRFLPDAAGPLLFNAMLNALQSLTWDELTLPGENRRLMTPSQMQLVQLLQEPGSIWWDRSATDELRERRDDVVLEALREAWVRTRQRHGNDPSLWRWDMLRTVSIDHLLDLPGFGRSGIPTPSGPGTLSPADGSGQFGASWRFVVELGQEVRAWGTYPGGQSGNPVSPRYVDRLPLWTSGQLAPLRTPRSADELSGDALMSTLRFAPAAAAPGGN